MTHADQTPLPENAPTECDRPHRGFWSGAWWKSTSVVLLVSPLLGFIISGIALFLLSVSLPSARRQWFKKLVVALMLLFGVRATGAYLAYEWAYYRGYQEAVLATERGEEFLIAGRNRQCPMCFVEFDFDLRYAVYSGQKAGNKAALPEYAHDPSRAIDTLIEKGCLVSSSQYLRVSRMGAGTEQSRVDRIDQLLERGSLFHSPYKAVVIEGDEITDADTKFINAFAWFGSLDYVELNAPQVSAVGLKALSSGSKTPGRRLWLQMGVLRISRSRLSDDDIRHFRGERDDVKIVTDSHADGVSNELRHFLSDAREKRAEWKSRQPQTAP